MNDTGTKKGSIMK